MRVPQFTIYVVGYNKRDAWENCSMPFDGPEAADEYVNDNGGKVFAMTVFGPSDPSELEEV